MIVEAASLTPVRPFSLARPPVRPSSRSRPPPSLPSPPPPRREPSDAVNQKYDDTLSKRPRLVRLSFFKKET